MWTVCENGKYQHLFSMLDKPIFMQGLLIKWSSICARAFAVEAPQPNPKKKKCKYCIEREDGHHG